MSGWGQQRLGTAELAPIVGLPVELGVNDFVLMAPNEVSESEGRWVPHRSADLPNPSPEQGAVFPPPQ